MLPINRLIAMIFGGLLAERFARSRVNDANKPYLKGVMTHVKNTMLRGFAVLAFVLAASFPADSAYAAGKKLCKDIPSSGKASFYGRNGARTANGEILKIEKIKDSKKDNKDAEEFTAAHRCLPFNTLVRVTNPETKKDIIVRINDRGPFVKNREMDLGPGAVKELGYDEGKGIFKLAFRIEKLGPDVP